MVTRYNDFRMNNITIIQKKMVFWDNARYIQNDNHALLVGVFWKNKMETLEPWIFEGELIIHERKQRLNMYQSSLLKSEIICFWERAFPVNGLWQRFSISSMLTTLMAVPMLFYFPYTPSTNQTQSMASRIRGCPPIHSANLGECKFLYFFN